MGLLYFARQYDRAIAQCRAVLGMDPNFERARAILVLAYVQSGRFAEALSEIERWTRPNISTWAWAYRAYVYGRQGRTVEAQHALGKFEQLIPQFAADPTQVTSFAYIGTGQKDQAIAALQKGYSQHSQIMATLKVDPIYDPLRSDPRFQQILTQVFKSNTN